MPETVTGLPAGYRTTAAKVMRILAMTTGTLVVVQFVLAGYGAFSVFNKHKGYGPHETLGTVIGVFTLLVLVAALISRPGVRPTVLAAVLFVLAGPVQPLLADLGKNHGAWWGGVHALVGVAILALCGLTSRKIEVGAPPDTA